MPSWRIFPWCCAWLRGSMTSPYPSPHCPHNKGLHCPICWPKPKVKIAKDDGKPLTAFGLRLDESGAPIREAVPPRKPGQDYGCDPLGDGKFRMVPSGDIVDMDERNRRLHV